MSKNQRPLAIIVLLFAVGAGMHVANGQANPPATSPPLNEALKTLVNQTKTIAPTATPPETPKPAEAPLLPPPSSSFGALDSLDERSSSPRISATPAPFVPSEVETFASQGFKIGEPRVIIRTIHGDITVKLFTSAAPRSTKAFLDLVRGATEFTDVKTSKRARRPFYDGLTFHRVLPGQMIQGGCPFGTGRGGPGFAMPDEISPLLNFDSPGMLALAPEREGTKVKNDTNGSQFFITATPQPEWNGLFTIIGEVEKGLSVVRKISNVKTGPTERPIRRVYIQRIDVLDDGSISPPEPSLDQTAPQTQSQPQPPSESESPSQDQAQ